jgi:hypothetical protein
MACVLLLSPALGAAADPSVKAPKSIPTTQRTFDTPRQAADALIGATADYDVPALKQILGPDSEDLIVSEDPVQDRNAATAFGALGRKRSEIVVDAKTPDRATLVVGDDDWPSPFPIVRKGGRWSFDTKAGRQEILNRRIGRNELDAIAICLNFVDAQHEYASRKRDGAMVNQYAQRVISTPGRQDGLAWRNPDGTWGGPLGEGAAHAIAEGYSNKAQPYHGYYFKVLMGQGPAAPMGKMDFVVEGAMIGGFALVAAPADYRVTGVKTFLVSHDGVVYEQDLGPKTLERFQAMERFDPDKGWTPTDGR